MRITSRWTRPFLAAAVVAAAGTSTAAVAEEHDTVTVYRSPLCGCCGGWIEYLEDHGYDVTVESVDDMLPVKQLAGVPQELFSCHTASIGDYTLEGHVPVAAIERLMEQQPSVDGLGVGGMPPGSPGMGGEATTPYTAYTFSDGAVGDAFMTFGED